MAIVKTDDKHYKAIADKIREHCPSIKNGMKPEQIAGNIGLVAAYNHILGGEIEGELQYSEGYENGKAEGIAEGYENGRTDGIQAERDNFWDVFQNHGEAMSYQHAFSQGKFTNENYNPKYPIRCSTSTVGGQYIFYNSPITDTKVEIIAGAGRPLSACFENCPQLHTIRKLILSGANTFSSTFANCTSLENITIEGTISNNISFADSTELTKESITNIIGCLSEDVSGKTLTLSIIAVAEGFAFDNIAGSGLESSEWEQLIATKPNWTISLVQPA